MTENPSHSNWKNRMLWALFIFSCFLMCVAGFWVLDSWTRGERVFEPVLSLGGLITFNILAALGLDWSYWSEDSTTERRGIDIVRDRLVGRSNKLPQLSVSRTVAQERIQDCINDANNHLLEYHPDHIDPYQQMSLQKRQLEEQRKLRMFRPRLAKWSKYTNDVLLTLFDTSAIADEFTHKGTRPAVPPDGASLQELIDYMQEDVEVLLSVRERLELFPIGKQVSDDSNSG